MLDAQRIQTLAENYSAQEFFAALIWQRRFNEFDGPTVAADLCKNSELWSSFLFTKPIYAPDKNGLSFNGVLNTLLAMANYRPMPENSMIQFVRYPADTLYLLTENRDIAVSQLLDLGKQWQTDEVSVFTGAPEAGEEDWRFREYAQMRLEQGLWGESFGSRDEKDSEIATMWWD